MQTRTFKGKYFGYKFPESILYEFDGNNSNSK